MVKRGRNGSPNNRKPWARKVKTVLDEFKVRLLGTKTFLFRARLFSLGGQIFPQGDAKPLPDPFFDRFYLSAQASTAHQGNLVHF